MQVPTESVHRPNPPMRAHVRWRREHEGRLRGDSRVRWVTLVVGNMFPRPRRKSVGGTCVGDKTAQIKTRSRSEVGGWRKQASGSQFSPSAWPPAPAAPPELDHWLGCLTAPRPCLCRCPLIGAAAFQRPSSQGLLTHLTAHVHGPTLGEQVATRQIEHGRRSWTLSLKVSARQ